MRVLLTTDAVGGVWSFTSELTAGLLTAGWDVALVSIGPSPTSDQRRWVEATQDNTDSCFHFATVDAPLEWMQPNGSSLSGASALLTDSAQDFGADLLHSNQFCFGALPLDIPKVITAHSDVLSWAKACRPEGLERSDWLERYCSMVQDGLSGADAVVAPTRWMLRALADNFDFSCQSHVVANGRDVLEAPNNPRQMQAVTAGRLWDEAKNIALLYDVSSPVSLMIAGDAYYDGATAPSGSGDVTLLGRLTEDELLALLRTSELYICPSRYEPFGLAPLEAALCGCAVLANDIPSLREVWQDGALYFSDAASLSELISRLHGDPELLSEAKASSFKQARKYSRTRMCASYVAIFEAALARDRETVHVA